MEPQSLSQSSPPTEDQDIEAKQAAERIYNLKIHEKTAFELEGYDQDAEVLPVPGGWLYRVHDYVRTGEPAESSNFVFIPFHQEAAQ